MVPFGYHPLFADDPRAEGLAGTHFLESGIYGKDSTQPYLFFFVLISHLIGPIHHVHFNIVPL